MNNSIAMVFPGQGSQSVGLLASLAESYPLVTETFAEASQALGYDLWQLAQNGPTEELNKTWHTQPILLTASVAIWRLWQQQRGAQPVIMAGHSLGEYSALVCASALSLVDAVKLVALRGKLMQEAVPEGMGAMYAIIGLSAEKIAQVCHAAAQGAVVGPVNFNAPGQVVIAGERAAVERAANGCKEAGAKRALPLPVSVPSHCELMMPAAEKLSAALQGIALQTPLISIINNVDVQCASDSESLRSALIRQLYSPVRWTETVEKMAAKGVTHLLEIGPGKVLTGLNKRIVESVTAMAVNDPDSLAAALTQ